MDFETRSCIDLKKLGATRYAWDASTSVLCLCWAYDQDEKVHLWHRRHEDKGVCWAEKTPLSDGADELIARIRDGELVEAHNAKFEFNIWNYVLMREFSEFDVPLPMEQMRCSAAKASCLSLPRALGDAANAIQLTERKDTDGKRLINKLSKPIKPRQKKGQPVSKEIIWCEEKIEHERNWVYCQQDVRTERALSNFCPEMTERELEYWFMDFRMNQRGINLDQRAAKEAIELCRREVERLDGEMLELTGRQVPGGSKRIAFKVWANEQVGALNNAGCKMEPIPDTRADTLSFALYGVPTKAAEEAKIARKPEMDKLWDQRGAIGATLKKAMEICLEVNRSSVAKFKTMDAAVCSADNVLPGLADGRLHDIMLYNGADRTGRWCLPPNAEILTHQGWVRFDCWSGSEIAQWFPLDGHIELLPATRVHFPYSGDMVRLKGARAELLCTLEHSIPLVARRGLKHKFVGSVSVAKLGSGDVAIPLGGRLVSGFEDPDVTRAVVMFQADGTVQHTGQYNSYKLGFIKERKITRCRELLTRLKLRFSEYRAATGQVLFVIPERFAPTWLRGAKEFGPWLLKHDPTVFIDELKHWDGHTGPHTGTAYYSVSLSNAEWVQTMAHLAGTSATVKRRQRSRGWQDLYLVFVLAHRGERSGLQTGWSFKREPYNGTVYCAETQTGYFLVRYNGTIQVTGNSGQGVQPHNFVRGYSKDMVSVWETLLALDEIGDHDLDLITLIEGAPLPVLAKACRGALIASENMELYAADFKAIEARKLAWMAGCASQLSLFRTGGDPYVAMASAIYNLPVDMLDRAAVKAFAKAHPTERQLGKKAVLGLGYIMGWEQFQATVWKEEGIWLDDKFCKKVVYIYRKVQCPEMPILWKATERAAIAAVQGGGEHFAGGDPVTGAGRISYFVEGRFLHCRLPSGRLLAYLDPEVHEKVNYRFAAKNERGTECLVTFQSKIGVPMSRVKRHAEQIAERQRKTLRGDQPESFLSPHLSFMGRHIITKEWKRLGTHGGSLTENADQASSRDLLAEAMYRIDQTDAFDLLLSIHDEVIAEGRIGTCTVQEFETIMSIVPPWATGLPLDCEGWKGFRLRK